jgi:hypothetical protein
MAHRIVGRSAHFNHRMLVGMIAPWFSESQHFSPTNASQLTP